MLEEDEALPQWVVALFRSIGSPIHESIVDIDLTEAAIDDRWLRSLCRVRTLRRLNLSRTATTDVGIAQLGALSQLRSLRDGPTPPRM